MTRHRTSLRNASPVTRVLFLLFASLLWAGALLFALVVGLIVRDLHLSDELLDVWQDPIYVQRGERYVCVHPRMARHSFSLNKEAGRLRIFAVGDSVDLGWPYVKRQKVLLPGLSLDSDKAGLGCWLESSLRAAGLETEVVNAGMEWGSTEDEVGLVDEILERGRPDMIVLFTGHCEGNRRFPEGLCPPDVDLDKVLDEVSRGFEERVRRMAQACSRAGVGMLILTAPINLRDWVPEDSDENPGLSRAEELVCDGRVTEARLILEKLEGKPGPRRLNLLGRIYSACGNNAAARKHLLKSNDLSRRLVSTRTMWNDILLAQAAPEDGVYAYDLASAFYEHSPDGIPGSEHFLDNCHLTLQGQKLAARLAGRFLLEQMLGRPGHSAAAAESGLMPAELRKVRTVMRLARFNLLRYRLVHFVLGLRMKAARLPSNANVDSLYENYTNRIREYSRALERGAGAK